MKRKIWTVLASIALTVLASISLVAGVWPLYFFVLRDTPLEAIRGLSDLNVPESAHFLPFSFVGFTIVGGAGSDIAVKLNASDFEKIVTEAKAEGFKEFTPESWSKEKLDPGVLVYPWCSCQAGDNCVPDASAPCGPERKVMSHGLYINKRSPSLPINDPLSLYIVLIDFDRKWVRAKMDAI